MTALEIKWGAPTYPRKFGCWFKAASFVLGPLLQDGVQWGDDPTPEQRRQLEAVQAEQRRQAQARRAALAKRLRGIRRRKTSGGDSNA